MKKCIRNTLYFHTQALDGGRCEPLFSQTDRARTELDGIC